MKAQYNFATRTGYVVPDLTSEQCPRVLYAIGLVEGNSKREWLTPLGQEVVDEMRRQS